MSVGDVIIVTGCLGSIGRALVSYLENIGCVVVGLDKGFVNGISLDDDFSTSDFNLLSEESLERLFSTMDSQGFTKNLVGMVNCAGLIHSEPLVNLLSDKHPTHSVGNWQDVLAANLTVPFMTSKHFANTLIGKRQGGVIINFSSIAAGGNIGQVAYSAAKGGLEAFTMAVAQELADFNIRCCAIAPGFFDVPSTREHTSTAVLDHVVRSTASRRLGTQEEICAAVRFILEAEFFNGRILSLDGGLRL